MRQAASHNPQIRKDVIDGIREGYSPSQLADLLNFSPSRIYAVIRELKDAGSIIQTGHGTYAILAQSNEAANPARVIAPKNGSSTVETLKRKAELPEFMRGRHAVTIYVERSPEELENVVRLELCIAGTWLPLPIVADVRLCVGSEIPRYSPTQETYNGVRGFRVTYANGEQAEINHNPDEPVTIDRKLS